MSILFKNIAKKANDLLSDKKYTTGGAKKFSIKTKTANGITYNAEAAVSGGSVKGKIGASLKHENGFAIKKLELSNGGSLTSEITLDEAVDNVQFSINVKLEPLECTNPMEETKLGATYTHNDFKADLSVSPLDPTSASASLCFHRDGCFFGGSAGLKLDDKTGTPDISGYDVGIGYSKSNSTAAFTLKDKLNHYQFSFFHQHSDALGFAATLDGDACPGAEGGVALDFGGSYKVDSDSTVHSKFSVPNGNTASANFSVNFDHQLNSNTKLGLTSVLPADFSGNAQFGLNLAFGI